MGGDFERLEELVDTAVSIHAPAWGATYPADCPDRRGEGFNPRPRMGGDSFWMGSIEERRVSIHAPAWGATGRCGHFKHGYIVSIHAPAWGATRWVFIFFIILCKFQSTPPHGGRLNIRQIRGG